MHVRHRCTLSLALAVALGAPAASAGTAPLHDQRIGDRTYGTFVNDVIAPEFLVTHSSEGADDFTVTGAGWTIDGFIVSTFSNNGAPPTALNLRVYADGGNGEPATDIVCFAAGLVATHDAETLDTTVTLPTPCDLDPGHYWLGWSFADVNLAGGAFGFWASGTAQSGEPAVWRNPGGSFQPACTSWGTFDDCPSLIDPKWGLKDYGFAVLGSERTVAPPQDALHDQMATGHTYGAFSNDVIVPEVLVTHSSAGADDFTVTDAGGWAVDAFSFNAYSMGGTPPPARVNLRVSGDGNGVPGDDVICFAADVPASYDPVTFRIRVDLPAPCELAPGTYWVGWAFADVDISQHFGFWGQTTELHGAPAVWRNPGGSFQPSCTAWSTFAQCTSLFDPAWGLQDFAFTVHGDVLLAEGTLHDQLASGNNAGLFVNDVIVPEVLVTHSSEGADDFTVSDATGWTVEGFTFNAYTNGPPLPDALNLRIYANGGNGTPGDDIVCFAAGLTVTTTGAPLHHASVTLPTPCELAPGNYWVGWSFADVDLTQGRFGFWGQVADQHGQPARWRNPGGSLSSACTGWTLFADCPMSTAPGMQDFAYSIQGRPTEVTEPPACPRIFVDGFDGTVAACPPALRRKR